MEVVLQALQEQMELLCIDIIGSSRHTSNHLNKIHSFSENQWVLLINLRFSRVH